MEAPREEPGPWVPGGLPAVVVGVVIALISFVALGLDPVMAFWALTAGLPLIAFIVISIVWLARRVANGKDDQEALP